MAQQLPYTPLPLLMYKIWVISTTGPKIQLFIKHKIVKIIQHNLWCQQNTLQVIFASPTPPDNNQYNDSKYKFFMQCDCDKVIKESLTFIIISIIPQNRKLLYSNDWIKWNTKDNKKRGKTMEFPNPTKLDMIVLGAV